MLLFKLFLIISLASAYAASHEEKPGDDSQISTPILRSLNPAKGVTIWVSPEKTESIAWKAYGDFHGKQTTVTVPTDSLEVTFSPYTCIGDVAPVSHGLTHYNLSKLHSTYHQHRSFKLPGSDLNGAIMGESVFLGCKSLSTLKKSLGIFENDAWTEGGKRVYVQLQDGKKGLAPLVKWTSENAAIYDFLLTKGYADVSGCMNLKTGGYESVLMKEMQPEGQTNPLTIQFDGDDENLPVLFENFGLFIRDSNGIAKGGLWGNLEQYASQPHTHINIFYIDGSIRGTGLGLILMDLVEDYAKSHGIKLLALETCEFQAPKFYEKFGYKRVQTIPKSFKDREGRCQVLK